MFIADERQIIKDTEEFEIKTGMIEKLDEMLTEYGVEHFFCLPTEVNEDGTLKNEDDCLEVFYDSKDRITFDIVYMLWGKTERGFSDDMIKKAMKKISGGAA